MQGREETKKGKGLSLLSPEARLLWGPPAHKGKQSEELGEHRDIKQISLCQDFSRPYSPGVVPRPAAAAPAGALLKMQIIRPCLRPPESETLEMGPEIPVVFFFFF